MNIAKIVFGGWIQCNKCSNWLQAGSQTVLFTMLCPHRNDFCHLQFTVSSKQCTNLLYYWVVQKVQSMFPCHPVEKSESTFWPMQCFSLGKYPSLLVLGILWSTGIVIPSPEGLYHFGVLPATSTSITEQMHHKYFLNESIINHENFTLLSPY